MTGRDNRGRFAAGNKLQRNGGRPPRDVEVRLFNLMSARLSDADWQVIVDKQVEKAKRGDLAAATWVADRLMGKPVERQELDAIITPELVANRLGEVWQKSE